MKELMYVAGTGKGEVSRLKRIRQNQEPRLYGIDKSGGDDYLWSREVKPKNIARTLSA